MASIAGIKGISYAPYRGGWKLRWRELHETESGVVRKALVRLLRFVAFISNDD